MSQKERHRRWRKANPDRLREFARNWRAKSTAARHGNWRTYGIDVAEARRVLQEHNGLCEICGTGVPGGRGGWHIDHDHNNKRIRGVLCNRCNLGLGFVDRVGLGQITNYLQRGSVGTARKSDLNPPANSSGAIGMKVHLQNVRLTFPQLYEAKQVNGQGDPKFSAAFMFPRNHPAIPELAKAVEEAANGKWGAKASATLAQLKAADKLCVHDGDAKSDYDGYAGNLFVNASNKIRPLVIDGSRVPLTAADGKPYSGCYVNAIVEIWAQDNNFGKRVNASLLGVQFLRDGERLAGGSVAAADDFEAIPETAAPAAASSGAAALF